jgi:DNA repair protein RadC
MQFKEIGEAKAIKITAAMELGRRHKLAQIQRRLKIISSQTVLNHAPFVGELRT